jgi:pilus assembly protein FimV
LWGGGALAALLALLAAGYFLVFKKKKGKEESAESVADLDSTIEMDSQAVIGDEDDATQGGVADELSDDDDASDTSFLSEFSPSDINALQDETGEVDPVSEADVYIAYGRYQQAEDLLRQAQERDPSRVALKHKLLEVHYATRDVDGFTSLAEEMVHLGEHTRDAEAWNHVLEMGRDLNPDNALFGGSGEQASDAADDAFSEQLSGLETVKTRAPSMDEFDDAGDSPDETSDLDLGGMEGLEELDLDEGGDSIGAVGADDDLGADLDLGDLGGGADEFDELSGEAPADATSDLDLGDLEGLPGGEGGGQDEDLDLALDLDEGGENLDLDDDEELDSIQLDLDAPDFGAQAADTGGGDDMMSLDLDGLDLPDEESQDADTGIGSAATGGAGLDDELALDIDSGDFDETDNGGGLDGMDDLEDMDVSEPTIDDGPVIEELVTAKVAPPSEDDFDLGDGGDAGDHDQELDLDSVLDLESDLTETDLEAGLDELSDLSALDAELSQLSSKQQNEMAGIDSRVGPDGADEAIAASVDADEVDTKLDLAEAFMEMGDAEGARSILEEVQQEGNADQQAKAAEYLAKL